MDIESVRNYCLSFPEATEDTPFGDDVLIFRVCNKIFASLPLTGENIIQMKCDPDYSIELRDRYSAIEPAFHWNKKYWIQLPFDGPLSRELVESLITHSYSEVVKKLPRTIRQKIESL